jgi:SAM-dependent methyltransferase
MGQRDTEEIVAKLPDVDCFFYHVVDVPGIGEVRSEHVCWDLRNRFDEYTGYVPMAGKSFLDVGTASGFLSFEAEKRGAIVTSFDAESSEQIQFIPAINAEGTAGQRKASTEYFPRMRKGYWYLHECFGSKARAIYGDIYKLSDLVAPSDIVMIGQTLVHVRDPLQVLQQAAMVAKETLIVTEGSFESDRPTAVFLGTPDIQYAWWHFSNRLYRHWLSLLGFNVIKESKGSYTLRADVPSQVEVWTFVAERISGQ